ncbi:MAG TPA: NUDIX domain-containing protein [Polyangiaceae bacterium]|nr:NUDIX domain-containing protein [Polyangiaceae bacterium]
MDFPRIELELLEDLTPPSEPGFLRLVRRRYRAHYPDGSASAPFVYDLVDRPAIDAVVLVAHYLDHDGVRCVFLRSCVRPPVAARDLARSPHPERDPVHGSLWELPAGLVEPSEQTPGGLVQAAQRELAEELGLVVDAAAFRELGASVFPVPAMIAERLYFFEVTVNPAERGEPSLDGSALERFGEVRALAVEAALDLCRSGALMDGKTELALRRLVERHGTRRAP